MRREDLDVLVIGAGLSGIGQACQLIRKAAWASFAILERRERLGGTWDLFRYPGIRSDSDMFTFGYRFRPWSDPKDIADGPSILKYLQETADEYGVHDKIRYRSNVVSMDWSSAEKRWIATVETEEETYLISARFVSSCTGYYNYDEGYLPEFDGYEDYKGVVAHPQKWPEDLDYTGKTVLIIGSGATAVTLVPAMAGDARHVTMLQRSPTYIFSRPAEDAVATFLRRFLPNSWAYKICRVKNVLLGIYIYWMCKRSPDKIRKYLRKMAVDELGPGFDVDTHFKPAYDPWDQRLCLIPDGDLYRVLKAGNASVVTDHIDRFTETGVALKSRNIIDADIIVPATGLQIQFLGGMQVTMDGTPLDPADHTVYRGMMLSGVPNLVVTFGYTNASWTLKSDLTADYVARLVNRMRDKGAEQVVPELPNGGVEEGQLLGLNSGYLLRAQHMLPKAGAEKPWKNHENYVSDMLSIRYGSMDDGVLAFS
ncbi:MAG: NAD(P)/FAD-dependent oxidoreductase [Pseudomonadota bacterium]